MTRCADGGQNGMDKRTRSGVETDSTHSVLPSMSRLSEPPHSFPLFSSACKGASPSCRRRTDDVTYFRKSSTTTHPWGAKPRTIVEISKVDGVTIEIFLYGRQLRRHSLQLTILTLHINVNGNLEVIGNKY
ncbi:uncharacterized protein LOC115245487 [Formica exsecta]|uniref:uncharacterized protein LOC115245487 n=1 Tax=Formica exsecta TaxID=72781 RepID=UPI0011411159|nr:uncharacterized protein LOC115245487 [Formica exsecta]